jgi:Outer membrane protein beta-barrel domain
MTAKSATVLGWLVVAAGSLFLAAHSAEAQQAPVQGNPLGLYVGVGAGLSTIRQDADVNTIDLGLSRSEAGWDAFVGIRPIPYLGAEIGYLDFGTARSFAFDSELHESADAPVAFAVGYIPLQPWWDLYLKAGAARLHRSWYAEVPAACPYYYGPCSGTYSTSGEDDNWDFAYGVGTQVSYGPLAWRLEYVRVDTSGNMTRGDPDLLSVGVSWTLF